MTPEYLYYRTYRDLGDLNHVMHVTPEGVYLIFEDGSMIDTGLTPNKIHQGKSELSGAEINDFHKFLATHDFQIGVKYSAEEFQGFVDEYDNETSGT